MDLGALYNENEKFQTYVDAYAAKHSLSVKEAMSHKIVQNVAEMHREPSDQIRSRAAERKRDS